MTTAEKLSAAKNELIAATNRFAINQHKADLGREEVARWSAAVDIYTGILNDEADAAKEAEPDGPAPKQPDNAS